MKVKVTKLCAVEFAPVKIHTPYIQLQDFLKFCDALPSGGVAKMAIQGGEVAVNGEICLMRGKKLRHGETVEFMGNRWMVENEA